ncbi:MAG TPA: hypothetical protein VGC42_12990 [Kofleriaceae bacterium]
MQVPDTSAIQRLIRTARRRIRGQWALEGATTALVLASAAALATVFLMRLEVVSHAAGVGLLVAAALIVVVGAVIKAARGLDDEAVARRIDRASNLADRLSTAIAFAREPGAAEAAGAAGAANDAADDETEALRLAAIRDGVKAVPRADVRIATPFVAPADLRAALGFLVISALAAGLALPTADRAARLVRVEPDHAAVGDDVVLKGANLKPPGAIQTDGLVTLGDGKAHPAVILDWAADHITVRVPPGVPVGSTTITAWVRGQAVGPLAFTVVDQHDAAYHKEGSVALDPDDKAYLDALLAELKAVAKRDQVPELEDFAKQIEQLLKDAELGKISKEQLLDAMAKAEDKLNEKAEPNQAELDKQLADMGKELSKDQTTKELGDALQKQDLDKAKQELDKLADKLDKQQLSEKDKQQLAKQLENVAKQMDQKDQKDQQKHDEQKKKLEDEVRRLEKKKDQAKTEPERLEAERQLDKKKDELQKLDKDQQDKDQSAQRQALKRLSRDMEKAAEDLQKPKPDPKDPKDSKDQKDQQQQRDQQASQKLKDAARETGRVDQDQRKQATQKKMSSQMDDLREAMRRAKQKGNKQNQDPFGKQGKNQDFAQRSRGQRGQSGAWKPGQGQRPGQGQGQGQGQQGQNGQGQGQNGGSEWGVGHDENLTGDPTQKSGNTKDADLQGQQGASGGGTRETILSAAQKGFASQRYKDVYGKYQQIVEDVMRTEKLPSSYKYYVKKYFAKIHPTTDPAGTDPAGPAPTGTSATKDQAP